MGVPEAKKVYENAYGAQNGRVIKEKTGYEDCYDDEDDEDYCSGEEDCTTSSLLKATSLANINSKNFLDFGRGKKSSSSSPTCDYTLDMVDLPTYNVSDLVMLGRQIATTMLKGQKNMGQMILFINTTNQQIIDVLHDGFNVIREEDTMHSRMQNKKHIYENFYCRDEKKVISEFFSRKYKHEKIKARIERVPIIIPSSQEEVDWLTEPPIEDMMMAPPVSNHKMDDYEGLDYWINKHTDVMKKRKFLTNSFLFRNMPTTSFNSSPTAVLKSRFKDAFFASQMEGVILYYAFRMIRVMKNLLKSKNLKGRYTVLFTDGKAPAIKMMTRAKRQIRQERSKEKAKSRNENCLNRKTSDLLFYSCERMMMRLPQGLMASALLDIMRIPVLKTTGSKCMYLSNASFTEAEDDIVRLTSCLLNLETPGKHFSLLEKRKILEYDSYNMSGNRKESKRWEDLLNVLKQHTNDENQTLSMNLFSHDSDVLVKWNLMVGHHKNVCRLTGTRFKDSETFLKIGHVKFFRCMNSNSSGENQANELGGFAAKRRTKPNTIYNLAESPLMLSPESTLLIMLTKGSDYNSAIVSNCEYDTWVRKEVAVFENTYCTCVGGWEIFLSEQEARKNNKDCDDSVGNISMGNLSKSNCRKCDKKLVLPFWTIKFFYLSQAIDFVRDPLQLCFPPTHLIDLETDVSLKHALHRALAVNAAANVMSYLTMGSFNQRVFGTITTLSDISIHLSGANNNESKNTGSDVESDTEDLIPFSNNKRKSGNDPQKSTRKKSKVNATRKSAPVTKKLSSSVFESIRGFFESHTEGGIINDRGILTKERIDVFGNNLDTNPEALGEENGGGGGIVSSIPGLSTEQTSILKTEQNNSTSDFLDFFKKFNEMDDVEEEEEKMEEGEKEEEEADLETDDWLDEARKAFEYKDSDFLEAVTAATNEMTSSLAKNNIEEDEHSRCSVSSKLNNKQPVMDEEKWAEIVNEFDKCISLDNITYNDNSLLSRLSGVLMDANKREDGNNSNVVLYEPVQGIDDERFSGVPYSVKTMNLLVIVYMNMCGLEDNTIVYQQLMPIIHSEFCGKTEEDKICTDRTNFMSAALEYTMLQYMPELKKTPRIKQIKRKNWERIPKVLDDFKDKVSTCTDNYNKLLATLTKEGKIPSENTKWLPSQGQFMPVLGVAISKPWSPLTLWSSFYLQHQQRQDVSLTNITPPNSPRPEQ